MAERTFKEMAIWLGQMQVELFESNQPVYMDVFCSGTAVRSILADYYNTLVAKGDLIAIENLNPPDKKELKQTAIEIAAGRLDTAGCVQLCKCLSVLTYHKTLNLSHEQQEVSTAASVNQANP